jgi:5-methylcytosine-specific restriction endonuclease McrA
MTALYGSQWRRLRAHHLQRNTLCVFCTRAGRMTPATVADHVTPHRDDPALFWDEGNLQSLCKTCHDGAKQALEKTGHLRGSNVAGVPLDPQHPWFREVDE